MLTHNINYVMQVAALSFAHVERSLIKFFKLISEWIYRVELAIKFRGLFIGSRKVCWFSILKAHAFRLQSEASSWVSHCAQNKEN
jgi:hypothetical protein